MSSIWARCPHNTGRNGNADVESEDTSNSSTAATTTDSQEPAARHSDQRAGFTSNLDLRNQRSLFATGARLHRHRSSPTVSA